MVLCTYIFVHSSNNIRIICTCQHLVDEDAEGPPVYCQPVPLALHDLGGEVLGRAAERPRAVAAHPLGEPEVGDLEVALAVKQQVLRLQIHPLWVNWGCLNGTLS